MKNGSQTKRKTIQVEESSGNVFADLGLPNAQDLQARSSAIAKIFVFLREHSLSEEDAARRVGVPAADLAASLRGDLDRFSIGALNGFLQMLETLGENRS